jgi:pantoate--beta-alanine ligase
MPDVVVGLQVIETIEEMRRVCREFLRAGKRIGFVPTMGALHDGHLSLVRLSRVECDVTVASIFVNPKQFGPSEDFSRYPRTFAEDCRLLEAEGVAIVFAPTAEEMYPSGDSFLVEPGEIATRLDGASRPGHFTGVATVVAKLFHIVAPTRAYFGSKDAMQVTVLRRMVRDLNFDTHLVACPIVREPDGLALSSRNRYLSEAEREQALSLSRTLRQVAAMVDDGVTEAAKLIAAAEKILGQQPDARIDYIALVDPDTLLPIEAAVPGALFAIAAWIGKTRLIDNWTIGNSI